MIIALCGRRKSGKSTVAKLIAEEAKPFGILFREYAFADALKQAYSTENNVPLRILYDPLYKEQHRAGLQKLSEVWKAEKGQDVFAKITVDQIDSLVPIDEEYHTVGAIVSDLRFFEELKVLNKRGAKIYKVQSDDIFRRRRGWEKSEVDDHASETELGDASLSLLHQYNGSIIYNNFMNEDDLRKEIKSLVFRLCVRL